MRSADALGRVERRTRTLAMEEGVIEEQRPVESVLKLSSIDIGTDKRLSL